MVPPMDLRRVLNEMKLQVELSQLSGPSHFLILQADQNIRTPAILMRITEFMVL